MQEKLIDVAAAAVRLGVSPRSIIDRRYRERVGLRCVRVGRRLLFTEQDIEAIIRRGREVWPGDGRQ